MIRGCMIDGFGWFREDDYRRAWLLFDEVDYIFPRELVGPLLYPAAIFDEPEYRAVRLSTEAEADLLASTVEADHKDKTFCALVGEIPHADRDYACQVVATDKDLGWVKVRYGARDPAAAFSVLTTKLLIHSARTGAVPIVGKSQAWALLASKTRTPHQVQAPAALLGSDRQQTAYSAFAAGLSLAFLPPGALTNLPFEKLQKFKADHSKLLERHQLHLLEVTQAFRGLLEGPDFTEQLAALRSDAARKRLELDQDATEAWRSTFADVAKHALAAGAAAAIPALTVLWSGSIAHIASTALPAALAALGVVATGVLDATSKIHKAHTENAMSYLFEAERSLLGS